MTSNPAGISEHLRFRREPELSGTLPASYYVDPEIFEREKEEIWFKTWQFVGYTVDLKEPGDYITADILDQKIFVVRGKDGALRAFYNVCMHRGHILVEGKGNRTIFTCPFHAWSYDAEGNLKAAGNAENVAGFEHADFGLSEIQVETVLGLLVFVNLDAGAATLASQIEGLKDQVRETVQDFDKMVFARRDRFDVKANWKFIFDQLECYHCPVVHPEVTESVDWSLRRHKEYGIWQRHNQRLRGDADNEELGRAYQIRADDPQKGSNIWYLWPNILLLSHWGGRQFQGIGRASGRRRQRVRISRLFLRQRSADSRRDCRHEPVPRYRQSAGRPVHGAATGGHQIARLPGRPVDGRRRAFSQERARHPPFRPHGVGSTQRSQLLGRVRYRGPARLHVLRLGRWGLRAEP